MNRMMGLIVAPVVALLMVVAAGCGGRDVDARLAVAESVMETDADSALRVLERIDGARLRGERGARYALLLTQAHDKNDMTDTDDSLIGIAYRHYMAGDDRRRQMLACHYMGVVSMNGGNYGAALSAALRAEKIALELGDAMNAARTEGVLSIIYYDNRYYDKAIEAQHRMIDHAKKAGRKDWVAIGFRGLVDSYISKREPDKAKLYVDSALNADKRSASQMAIREMYIANEQANYRAVDSLLSVNTSIYGNRSAHIYILGALANMRSGNIGKARELLSECQEQLYQEQDTIDMAYAEREYAIRVNDYTSIIRNDSILSALQDRVFYNITSNSLYKAESAHEKEMSALMEYRSERRTSLYKLAIGVLIVIPVILILIIVLAKKRAENRLLMSENQLWQVLADCKFYQDKSDRTGNELAMANRKIMKLKDQVADLNTYKRKIYEKYRAATNDLRKSRQSEQSARYITYEWVNKLTKVLDSIPSTSRTVETVVYKMIVSELSTVKSTEFLEEAINVVNSQRNGLLTRVDNSGLNLTGQERELLIYLCIGLSLQSIQFLTGKNISTLYKQKARLKEKLVTLRPNIMGEVSDIFRVYNSDI